MTHARTIDQLPLVVLPDDYGSEPGPFMAQTHAQHGPIFRTTTPTGETTVHVVGPDANHWVMVAGRDKLSNEEGWARAEKAVGLFGKGLTFLDGDSHRRHRSVLTPEFTPKAIDGALPQINHLIHDRLESWTSRRDIDIYAEAHYLTLDISLAVLLGMTSVQLRKQYRDVYLQMFWLHIEAASTQDVQDQGRWVAERQQGIQQQMQDLLRPMINQQRKEPSRTAFGRLCGSSDSEPFSDAEIIAEANTLLLAGHITTTSLATWLVYLLLKHPRYLEGVTTEAAQVAGDAQQITAHELRNMPMLDNCLKEAERLYPPIADLPRVVIEETEFGGYLLPVGTYLRCSLVGSHYLPKSFKRPRRFEPERFAPPREEHLQTPYSLVGFSGGPRLCLGVSLARTEIKAFIAAIVARYQLRLAPRQNIIQIYHPMSTPAEGVKILVKSRI